MYIRFFIFKMNSQRNSYNVTEREDNTKRHKLRHNQEADNPCYKEHLLSLKCLNSNHKNQKVCEVYFINYRSCKNFWATVQSERRLKGIKPYLPPLEERAKIKADFLNSR